MLTTALFHSVVSSWSSLLGSFAKVLKSDHCLSVRPSVGDLEENTTKDFGMSLRHPINLREQREGHQFECLLCKFFSL
jgi:hypothetical protein